MRNILTVDTARLLALLTVWHTDEVTDEAEAKEKGEELIRRMKAEAGVKTFAVNYHHRHGNDIEVVAADTEPDTDTVIEAMGLNFKPDRDEYIDVFSVNIIPVEDKRCARCGGVILTTGFCSNDCPFDRHKQDCPVGWIGHPEHPDVDESTKCRCQNPDGQGSH